MVLDRRDVGHLHRHLCFAEKSSIRGGDNLGDRYIDPDEFVLFQLSATVEEDRRECGEPGSLLRACFEVPGKPGSGSFVRGLCWLGPYSPLRGCLCPCGSTLRASAAAKTPRRRTSRNFKTRAEGYGNRFVAVAA